MADKLSKEEAQAFIKWLGEQVGGMKAGLWELNAMLVSGSRVRRCPEYVAWQQAGKPYYTEPTKETTARREGLPLSIRIGGKDYPVNWRTEYSAVGDLYIPVLPLDVISANPEEIYKHIYGVNATTGEQINLVEQMEAEGLTWADLGIDLNGLYRVIAKSSIMDNLLKQGIYSRDIETYVEDNLINLVEKQLPDIDIMTNEAIKMAKYPGYVDALKLKGRLTATEDELVLIEQADRQRAAGLETALKAPELGEWETEEQSLRKHLEYLQPMYERYGAKREAGLLPEEGPLTTSEQLEMATLKSYEQQQQRLTEIEAGGGGWTKTSGELSGEKTPTGQWSKAYLEKKQKEWEELVKRTSKPQRIARI